MIMVTHLNGEKFLLNCDLIEFIEVVGGPVISFVSGKKIRVLESPEQIVRLITQYKRSIYLADPVLVKNNTQDL
ncbi:MAG: flagellar FlbD family protein [Clostridiaceae bacterium]|nr:flagellar FlbD family protein [Clostridiaceae bacterium]